MVRPDSKLADLLDKFVCVRFVKMQGVDLEQFQFDYDLTFACVFAHADGTVYGRYGARQGDDAAELNSLVGLGKTLQRVLALHGAYPKNKAKLIAKRGAKPEHRFATDIPVKLMRQRAGKATKGSCVHCHQVHEARQDLTRSRNETWDPRRYAYRFPTPEQIGLRIDKHDGTLVASVRGDTVAHRAGFAKDDRVDELDGQAITSIADIAWVLEHLDKREKLQGVRRRDGKRQPFTLEFTPGWRRQNLGWRASMYAMPPRPGIWLEQLDGYRRARTLVPKGQLCLHVRKRWGKAATRSGLRDGDVIIAVDGQHEELTPGQFHAYLRLRHFEKGARAKLKVRRGDEIKELVIEF